MLKNLFILVVIIAFVYGVHAGYTYFKVIPNENICGNFMFNNVYSFINSGDKSKMLLLYRRQVGDCRRLLLNNNLYFRYDRNAPVPCSQFVQNLGAATTNYADFVSREWNDKNMARFELAESLKYLQDYRYCSSGPGKDAITRERINLEGKLRDL